MNPRSGAAFWAVILITVGAIFLLQNLGVLRVGWGVLWPVFLILIGGWLLLSNFIGRGSRATSTQLIPLDGAREARLEVHHGAGELRIGSSADPATLINSTFDGELEQRVQRDGERVDARLSLNRDWTFWMWPGSWWGAPLHWRLDINREVPLTLDVHTGASTANLDLRELKVRDFKLETGASTIDVYLPANGQVAARVKAGAATVRLHLPESVAARVRGVVGVGTLKLNEARFPYLNGVHQSPNYDTAANRVDLSVEAGAATVTVM
ncbi:MAG TPA: DUF5668 domain-containing protein [Anaerolineae bacterium]|nr:DUF5668 domain-containing protein [Anaerolineae bacterium]